MMKSTLALAVSLTFLSSLPQAHAQDMLTLAAIKANAEKAAARRAALDQKIADHDGSIQAATGQARDAIAKKTGEAASSVLPKQVASGSTSVVEEVVCKLTGSDPDSPISGVVSKVDNSLTLLIGSISSAEESGERLAIQFSPKVSSGIEDVEFKLLDLNQRDGQFHRLANLADLGIEAACHKEKKTVTDPAAGAATSGRSAAKVVSEALQVVPWQALKAVSGS